MAWRGVRHRSGASHVSKPSQSFYHKSTCPEAINTDFGCKFGHVIADIRCLETLAVHRVLGVYIHQVVYSCDSSVGLGLRFRSYTLHPKPSHDAQNRRGAAVQSAGLSVSLGRGGSNVLHRAAESTTLNMEDAHDANLARVSVRLHEVHPPLFLCHSTQRDTKEILTRFCPSVRYIIRRKHPISLHYCLP